VKDFIKNLIHLEPQNLVPEMIVAAILVWAAVVAISLLSLYSQRSRAITKLCWTAIIVALPLIGLLAYCIYAFFKLDLTSFAGFLTLRGGRGKGPGGRPTAPKKPAPRALPSRTESGQGLDAEAAEIA
jgi:hypothetical protein